MRKAFLGVLVSAVAFLASVTTAFAAGPKGGRCFVDADGDGICDNCSINHWCSIAGNGCGRNFVDADGDGVCDNYVSGQGRGNGHGNGRGSGFRGGRGR